MTCWCEEICFQLFHKHVFCPPSHELQLQLLLVGLELAFRTRLFTGHFGCNSDHCSGVRALGEGRCFSWDYVLHCWLDTTLMKVNKNCLWESWRFSRCYPGLRCHICFLCGPYVDSTALIKALHLLTSNALARVTSVRNPAIWGPEEVGVTFRIQFRPWENRTKLCGNLHLQVWLCMSM